MSASHQAHLTLFFFGTAGTSGWVDYKEYERAKGKEKALVIARNHSVPMKRDPDLLNDTSVQLSIVGRLLGVIMFYALVIIQCNLEPIKK